jgi:hypothetical protein
VVVVEDRAVAEAAAVEDPAAVVAAGVVNQSSVMF